MIFGLVFSDYIWRYYYHKYFEIFLTIYEISLQKRVTFNYIHHLEMGFNINFCWKLNFCGLCSSRIWQNKQWRVSSWHHNKTNTTIAAEFSIWWHLNLHKHLVHQPAQISISQHQHQPASISINQRQSASISINQRQSASTSISISQH